MSGEVAASASGQDHPMRADEYQNQTDKVIVNPECEFSGGGRREKEKITEEEGQGSTRDKARDT